MALLALLLLLMIPVSMMYCAAYLMELIRMWKYTTVGAKICQASISVISGIVLAVVIYVLKTY